MQSWHSWITKSWPQGHLQCILEYHRIQKPFDESISNTFLFLPFSKVILWMNQLGAKTQIIILHFWKYFWLTSLISHFFNFLFSCVFEHQFYLFLFFTIPQITTCRNMTFVDDSCTKLNRKIYFVNEDNKQYY